jgi:hypothetical protein
MSGITGNEWLREKYIFYTNEKNFSLLFDKLQVDFFSLSVQISLFLSFIAGS